MATAKTPVRQDTIFLKDNQQTPEEAAAIREAKDYSKWSVYKKLARAKVMLQKSGLKKSGYNPYDKFYYFDLGDFLPRTNEIFDELGLIGVFVIEQRTDEGVATETASLTIINIDDPDEFIEFSSPTAEAAQRNPIQGLGSKHTYMRRYLYMEALDIAETDMVDAGAGTHMEGQANEVVEEKLLSPKQKELLMSNFALHAEFIKEELAKLNKKKFDELTMKEASGIIQQINQKNMEAKNNGTEGN